MKTTLYLAYGSNLDGAQMRRRCPTARREARALLRGYRMSFAGYSRWWGGGVATLVPDAKGHVRGVLYRVTWADLERLDGFEGVPWVYERTRLTVRTEEGAIRRPHVYLHRSADPTLPSARYLGVIARAYRTLGYSIGPLHRAIVEAA